MEVVEGYVVSGLFMGFNTIASPQAIFLNPFYFIWKF